MPLTHEQLLDCAEACKALARGEPIEVFILGKWVDADGVDTVCHHRPKRVPVARPWSKPSDVPFPCVLVSPGKTRLLATGVCSGGIYVSGDVLGWNRLNDWRWTDSFASTELRECTTT